MLGSRWIAPLRRLGPVLATIVVLCGAAPALASAADRYVATTGSDAANNCLTQATPCLTVQHAVLQSGNGDDVNVATGTYAESVTVGVSVEIDGPFGGTAGGDPSRGGAGEARIVGVGTNPAITIEADGVGIQGMALGPASGPAAAGTTGVHLDDFSTTTAIVDTLIENVARGVDLKDGSFPIMVFSAVHGAGDAAVVLEHVEGPFFADNELTDGDGDGIRFAAGLAPTTSITFDDNDVFDLGGGGVLVESGALAGGEPMHGNRIVATADPGLTAPAGAVDATDNWWGCNTGPDTAGCDDTSGVDPADVSPWTVMTLSAAPTTIATNGAASDVTASFNTNSDGDDIGPPEQGVPDHLTVAFSTTLGAIDPTACTCGGEALATLTSGAAAGTADVTATIDGESLTTQVQIVGPSASLTPASVDFGSVELGRASRLQSFALRNTGVVPLPVDDVGFTPPDFADFEIPAGADGCTGRTLDPGRACIVKARFVPTGSPGGRSSFLAVGSNGATVAGAPLSGVALTAAKARLAPIAPVDFRTVPVGQRSALRAWSVKNVGQGDVTLGSIALTGEYANQYLMPTDRDHCTGTTLSPGESCSLRIRFAPNSAGGKPTTLEVPSDAVPTLESSITGSGTTAPAIRATPSPLDFGDVAVGSRTRGRNITVKNTGGSDLTLGAAELTGSETDQFVITRDTCDGVTLAPREFCTIRVRFAPTGAAGPRNAGVQILTDGPPATGELQGNAIET